MSKTETIRARVEPEIKYKAEAVLKSLGLSATEAITLFYHQIALQNGLPFQIKIPNALTQEVLEDALSGVNMTEYESLEALKKKFS
jgi:DNA-damage-inducible protein J